jgi:hypothetical protein
VSSKACLYQPYTEYSAEQWFVLMGYGSALEVLCRGNQIFGCGKSRPSCLLVFFRVDESISALHPEGS